MGATFCCRRSAARMSAEDDPFSSSVAAVSFERFIATINQPAARDLVKNINL